MTGIERLRALADEMARGGWQGLGGELRSIAEQIEREQETDDAAPSRRAERTCRMIDNGCELCCSECDARHAYDDEPNYCSSCGAKAVEG